MSNNAIKVHKISQGNGYLNGKSLLGQLESVDLPDVKFMFEEFKAMGMVGKMDLPTLGVDKLEGKFKFNSIYPDVFKQLNPLNYQQLQIRSSVNVHSTGGVVEQKPLVTIITFCPKKLPLGKFEQHKNVDIEIDFTAIYVKQVFDGEEVIEYDAMANILKIGGVDVLAEYRSHI